MKKLIALSLIFFSTVCAAEIATFKITQNNPADYGEESYQIKTTKGQLSIYSILLSKKNATTLDNVKKGQCIQINSPDKLTKSEGYYSIDHVNWVKVVKCPK